MNSTIKTMLCVLIISLFASGQAWADTKNLWKWRNIYTGKVSSYIYTIPEDAGWAGCADEYDGTTNGINQSYRLLSIKLYNPAPANYRVECIIETTYLDSGSIGVSSAYRYEVSSSSFTCPGALVWDPITSSCKARLPDPKNNGSNCPVMVLDPVNAFTGNSYQPQTDYVDSGLSSLSFRRSYNSQTTTSSVLGANWQSNFHRGLSVTTSLVNVTRPDGKVYPFKAPTTGSIWINDADVQEVLEKTVNGWRYTTRNDVIEDYDATGKLTTITHKNGDVHTLTYNASGQLDRVTDSLGRSLGFTYDSQGRVATLIDPAQRNFIYGYDANNNLASVTYPDTTTKQYLYEDSRFPHGLTGIIDQRNQRYSTWSFDAQGRVMANYRSGNVDRGDIAYNTNGTTTLTNSRNIASTYSFINQFGVGLVSNITGPGCSSCGSGDSSYQYDPANSNLLSKTVKGLTTTYANYDTKGNAATITQASGTPLARTTTYTYDSRFFSKVATKTEPSVCATQKKTTTYSYDNFGNPTSIAINGYTPTCTPVSRTTTLQYTGPLNQLSQIDGPRSDVSDITTLNYYPNDTTQGNNRGRLQRVTLANGILARDNVQYTATGKVLSELRPNGVSVNYSYYPGNDRLQTVTPSDGVTSRTTRWTYLPTGEVETITQGDGTSDATTLTFGYDAARRLVRISDALNNRIEYVLDTEGNQEQENTFDNSGVLRRQLTQTFDLYNRLDTTAQANETRDLNIAPDGTLSNQKDGKAVTTHYSYDALKRLTQATADVGGTDVTTQNALTKYGYNVHDELTTVTAPNNGVTTFIYDDVGNLLSQTSPDTGITTQSDDAAGNVVSRTDAKGQVFNYSYDTLNRLTLLDAPGSNNDISYAYDHCANGTGRLCAVTQGTQTVTYAYNAFGQVTAQQGVNYSYDAQGRLSTLTYPSGNRITYAYDATGNVSRLNALIGGSAVTLANNAGYAAFGPLTTLTYGNGLNLTRTLDGAYRLLDISVSGALLLTGSVYDANGNLLQRTDNLLSTRFAYDNLERLDTALGIFGSRDYTLDKNSNRTQLQIGATATTYSYRPASNVMTNLNGSGVITDAVGNTTSLRGMTLTYDTLNHLQTVNGASYTYNALNQRTQKVAGGNTTSYVYGLSGELLAEAANDGVTEYVYLHGAPMAMVKQGNVYYLHTDQLGTPRAMTDASKKVVWRWDSDPFGATAANEDPDNDGVKVTMNLRFPGQYFDAESGLHFNWNRYYDPATGRYVTSDPIGLAGGLNTFGYAKSNPIKYFDSRGKAPQSIGPFEGAQPPSNTGGPWTWHPDQTNDRGGSWRDPKGRSASWDMDGHWDIDDGRGNRQRYDRWGNPITPEAAHKKLKPKQKPIKNIGKICEGASRLNGAATVTGTIADIVDINRRADENGLSFQQQLDADVYNAGEVIYFMGSPIFNDAYFRTPPPGALIY